MVRTSTDPIKENIMKVHTYEITYADRYKSIGKTVQMGTDGQSVSEKFQALNPDYTVLMVSAEMSIM